MANEPISKKPRASSIQDADLLLISQKQSDDSYESKGIEASALKGKDGLPGAKGDPGKDGEPGAKGEPGEPGPIKSTYNTQMSMSPDYQNNQNSLTSAAGYFLKRDLTPTSFSCHLYYKTRLYIPDIPQTRTPIVTAKLLSIFVYLDQNGNILDSAHAQIFSGSPQFHTSSGRWYLEVKVVVHDVIISSDVGAKQIAVISDAMSIIDGTAAKRLNYSSDISGMAGILPRTTAGEFISGPKIVFVAL